MKDLRARLPSRSRSLFLAALLAGACGGGGGGARNPDLDADLDAGAVNSVRPEIALRGGGAIAHFWTNTAGAVRTAEYASRVAQVSVRVTMSAETGDPARLDDLEGRGFVLLQDHGDERVDLLQFDHRGAYLGGFAIRRTAGGYEWANILARSAFAGQVSGQLVLPTLQGSFALIVDSVDSLGAPTPVDPDIVQVAEALARRGGTVSVSRCLSICGIAIAPQAFGAAFAPIAGAAGVLIVAAYQPSLTIRALTSGHFAAGTAALQEYLDHMLGYIVDPARTEHGLFWPTLVSCVLDGVPYDDPIVTAVRQVLAPRAGVPASLRLPTVVTLPTSGPPGVVANCSGQALWEDGRFYPLTGIVDGNGRFDCSGMRDGTVPTDLLTILGLVESAGVSGVCNLGGVNGTINGDALPIGTCSSAREDGGRGTFTFAHYIGPGTGVIDFSYNAFSIPDQLIVRTRVGERFNTGGLVSGSQTVTLPIADEPVVFVSVRAPRGGTQWNYSVSCLR